MAARHPGVPGVPGVRKGNPRARTRKSAFRPVHATAPVEGLAAGRDMSRSLRDMSRSLRDMSRPHLTSLAGLPRGRREQQ
ncbi:hypothetical protein predicted by Glimmer/Critica [Sorangium cellulosum So ce56]|uniref:Uncharacterized protein n=1 Tax=Sorangium cellulosum (strain So ce56) TaxID=448385 RepID=A9EWT4_SORC5|nr:hypothetical protein predicted by Glimmer/Critica [Sorangium cellulosum So ce56]